MTDSWIQQACKFAKYILILFRPWDQENVHLPGALTWKSLCDFLRELRNGPEGKGPTILGRIRLAWIGNMSRGLRMSTLKRVAASQYRMRNATVLGKPDGTSDINKQINQNRGATDFEFDNAGNDDDSSNDRKFAPDDRRL